MKADRRITDYHFYLVDDVRAVVCEGLRELPYPAKIWLNGHEYTEPAAARDGIALTELANGFGDSDDPAGLQKIWSGSDLVRSGCSRNGGRCRCGRSRSTARWCSAGRGQARSFFEGLCVDGLDLGRPEEMQLVFGRRLRTDPVGGRRSRLLRFGDGAPDRDRHQRPSDLGVAPTCSTSMS